MKNNSIKFVERFFVLVLSVLISCPYAFAEGIGKVTYAEGRADLLKQNSELATPVREGDVISVGDALRTKSNSKVEVTFNDKSVLRLAQNSKVDINDYQLDKDNKRKTATINLERGKARTIIAKMSDSANFVISTPNAKGTVKGSDIFAFYQAGNTGMLVSEGRLSIANTADPASELIVPAGNSVLVPLDESPKGPREYLELERKLNEQETNVPVSMHKKEKESVIKGVISKVSGDVKIMTKGSNAPHDATINEIIGEGDSITTGSNGAIAIRFDNGNALNLKPDTKLSITRLTIDPKTGEYENLFEASTGKVRARIENLKGKSKFEVKTPTAISGARGTIMYVEVLPNMTKSFFEGGNGYLTNVMNGMTKLIAAGQNSYADNNGAVGDSSYTSDDQRMGFGEGWEPGNGVEGYSSPDGGTGNYILGPNFGGGGAETPDAGNGTGEFNGLPFSETNGTGSTTTTTPTSFDMNLDGEFGRISSHNNKPAFKPDSDTSISLTATASSDMPAQWSGILSTTLSGLISDEKGLNFSRGSVTGSSSEGGNIVGWTGGTAFSEDWKGALATIYIDPTGRAGVLFGNFAGENDEGVFSGIGDISIIPMADVTILPEDLAAATVISSSTGDFHTHFDGNDGFLETSFARQKMSIRTEGWGILQDVYRGQYRNRDGMKTWVGTETGSYNSGSGYRIRTFEGTDDLNGNLVVDIMATYLTYTTSGAYSETMLGKYTHYNSHSDNFEGLGFGTWTEQALFWSTDIDGRFHHYSEEDKKGDKEVHYHKSSVNDAIIGATASPFETLGAPVNTVLMGEVSTDGLRTWWGRLGDESRAGDETVMPVGVIGGSVSLPTLKKDDGLMHHILKGSLAALYIDEFDNAGTLIGDFTGEYMPNIGMWTADGTMKATQRATGYHHYHLRDNDIKGYAYGGFRGGGKIYIPDNENIYSLTADCREDHTSYIGSHTYSLSRTKSGPAETWGVFNLELGGYFTRPAVPTDNWTLAMGGTSWAINSQGKHDYWVATVKGDQWSGGQVTGALKGVWFVSAGDDKVRAGTISGKVNGDYIDVQAGGTWQAPSAGEWVEVSELLDEHMMFGPEGLSRLDSILSIPITEVYSNILSGSNNFITNASMNISLYNNANGNLWTAIFAGAYSGAPENSNGWSLILNNGNDTATLTGTTWQNNQWLADVSGVVGGNNVTGQAGGQYGDGTFSGVGAGTYTSTTPQ